MCWKFSYTKQTCGVFNNHHCVKLCLCYQMIFVTYFRPLWVLNWGEGPELTDKKVNWWCSGGEQVEMLHINQWNAAAPGAEACAANCWTTYTEKINISWSFTMSTVESTLNNSIFNFYWENSFTIEFWVVGWVGGWVCHFWFYHQPKTKPRRLKTWDFEFGLLGLRLGTLDLDIGLTIFLIKWI